ncbi:LacI family DNA-binding transcriptional regulator [Leifsonia shinshuensis]|uniref:LacI family transcriptional regulator n=1 Tax=Leifsonia shinshuensis TaxID=150026 RepID=A0A7G6YAC9_9MICO|nr:LacI family DNA-binding transcriptional regulator [Leifsonia shinshuensis]QNE35444.1 LacI family transcriptional regulator [Leifsonia shinshuensis]
MTSLSAPTLADVAAHAGVSLATASRALHPSARTVRPELKQRVEAAAVELGYSVNAQAQAVARGSNNTVALVVGDIADPYFASIAAGVMDVAKLRGLIVTIATLPHDNQPDAQQLEAETLTALRAQRPRAVLFASSRDATADWSAFEAINQLAIIGPEAPGLRSVVVGNHEGAADLARTLSEIGYSDFAIVAGPAELSTVRDRVAGFASIAPGATVHNQSFSRDGGYEATADLLASGRRPECVFAVTDVMAIGAISAIRDAGLTPGIDVAVAGFDDIPLLRDVSPRLTTVALPLDRIGASALELALDNDGEMPSSVTVSGHVLLRESTPGLRR